MSLPTGRPTGLGRPLQDVLDHIESQGDRHFRGLGLVDDPPPEPLDEVGAACLELLRTSFRRCASAAGYRVGDDGPMVRMSGARFRNASEIFDSLTDLFAASPTPPTIVAGRSALVAHVYLPRGPFVAAVWRERGGFRAEEHERFAAIASLVAVAVGAAKAS